MITEMLGDANTYQNIFDELYHFHYNNKKIFQRIQSYKYMIKFLPLEISVTKYQTFPSELLKTLNQYVKCQQDIVKCSLCSVKEPYPEYSHW